jgi:transposase
LALSAASKGERVAIWFRKRVDALGVRKKKMIVALARKLLIGLWRLVRTDEVPQGVVLRPTERRA